LQTCYLSAGHKARALQQRTRNPCGSIGGLSAIYAANPLHKFLVDNTRQRSLADSWVIAHAMNSNACVVTKENLETAANSKRIKIPNVCENMGIRWINDFSFIEELNISFSCVIS
jgi:hypothetical protein